MTMRGLSWKVMMLTLGLFAAISFTLCVIYGLVVPARFHAASALETLLPGFRWLTPGSFVLGLVETFVYGAYAGLALTLLYNWLSRHLESPEGAR
jgi:hypothetical protein